MNQDPVRLIKDSPVITRVVAAVDEKNKKVLLLEQHGPAGIAESQIGYSVKFFRDTSPLVDSAELKGSRAMYMLSLGKSELELKPSTRPSGIESVSLSRGEVAVTFVGLGGAGVIAVEGRKEAEFATKTLVLEEGGGRQRGKATIFYERFSPLIFSIDNTDKETEGATWRLAYDVIVTLAENKLAIPLTQTNVQLFPECEYKSRNNVVTVTSVAVKPGEEKRVSGIISDLVFRHSLVPEKTGIAFFGEFLAPNILLDFGNKVKRELVTLDEAIRVAGESGVQFVRRNSTITSNLSGIGVIGAVAALPYWNKQMSGALDV